ncbi:MAG: stage II sporulation protein D [Thermincolia bacterium]
MGRLLVMITAGVLSLLLIPVFLLKGGGSDRPKGSKARDQGLAVRMYHHEKDKIITLPLDQYLIGVLAAEMPAVFHPEALQAQAIAARTYTLKRLERAGGRSDGHHPGADICNDPQHNQAWIDEEAMIQKWGKGSFNIYYEKLAQAVGQTDGQILLYQGQVINPVYHASCGGVGTENAAEVWSGEVPYLKSVDCSLEKDNPKAKATLSVSLKELDERLGPGAASVATGSNKGIRVLERTATGRVKTLGFGEGKLRGQEVRQKLGLRSTQFTWQLKGDQLVFETLGNGHGVGLCQYGANYMALAGKDYRQILTHYYTDVELADYWQNIPEK